MVLVGFLLLELIILFFLSRAVTTTLSQLLFHITRSTRFTVYMFALLFLPGTVVHELAHFITAAVLLVPIGDVEFIPVLRDGSVKLGSVAIAKIDPFRRSLIGAAPLFVGVGSIVGTLYFFGHTALTSWWQLLLVGYVVFEIGTTMFSSKKDLEGSLVVVVLLFVLFSVAFFLGVDVVGGIERLIVWLRIAPVIEMTLYFLLLPIVLDSVVVIFGRIALRYLSTVR